MKRTSMINYRMYVHPTSGTLAYGLQVGAMERWAGRVALVTGASTGIGAAICRELVKHAMTVIGCARNDKQIEVCVTLRCLLIFLPPTKCFTEHP